MSEETPQEEHKEVEKKITTLLPPASIHMFSDDFETLNLVHSLGEDWRFGRINMGIRGTNLDEAIEHYSRRKSPTLIIIQTDTTDADFQAKLEDLAGVCDEGTAAIVIGPVNDVQLYRHLTNMGISDYLVAPVADEDMVEAIAGSLQDIVGAVDSQLIAFIGAKGGVGTSSITAIAGTILANDLNAKTLVMDCAGAYSTLWNQFSFSPSGTLIEAARAIVDHDEDAFNRLLFKSSDNLHILNAGSENIFDNPVATQAFEMLLDKCLALYPYVVLDLSNAPTQIKRMAMARANMVGVITTPLVPDLSMTKIMVAGIRDLPGKDGRDLRVIINKIGQSKSNEVKTDDAKDILEISTALTMPYNGDLFITSDNNGQAIDISHKDYEPYRKALLGLLTSAKGFEQFKEAMEKQMSGGLKGLIAQLTGKGG